MRVVSKGLQGDEWIVVNGIQRARPGSPVDPERPEGTASEAVADDENPPAAEAPAETAVADEEGTTTAAESPAETAAAESTRPR